MESLIPQKSDLRMLREEIVDRRGSGFLDAGDHEIDALNFAASEKVRCRLCFVVVRFHALNS